MTQAQEWESDPLVRLEKRLYPLVVRMGRMASLDKAQQDQLIDDLRGTAEQLRVAQQKYFDACHVVLPGETIDALTAFADKLRDAAAKLARTDTTEVDRSLMLWCQEELLAEVEDLLDLLRAGFLAVVLSRQEDAKRRAEIAAVQIAQISRQIYFISINASVEAARAGEAGKGFAVIGEQIRALSQDASQALQRMNADDEVGRKPLASGQAAR